MRQCLKILLVLLGFFQGGATVFAQNQMLTSVLFDEEKGLNVTSINDIFQDREGFLWLATREGLVRFDGYTFKYFRNQPGDSTSISNNHVFCITEDKDGNIWLGLYRGGISCYNRVTGQFRNYPFTEKLKIKTSSVVRIFIDREARFWVGLGGYGIAHFDPKSGAIKKYDLITAQNSDYTPEEIAAFNTASDIWQDENGLLWCATAGDLVSLDPKTGEVTRRKYDKVAKSGFKLNQAYNLYPEGDFLWMGGWGSGLRRFNRKTGEWKQYFLVENAKFPDAVNVVNGIVPKSKDEFWISSADQGLCIFNKETEKFTLPSQNSALPGLPTSGTWKICIDKQGNIWLNSQHLQRLQLKDKQFIFNQVDVANPYQHTNPAIKDLLEDRDDRFRLIGLISGDGMQLLDKKTGKKVAIKLPGARKKVDDDHYPKQFLQAKNGTVWVLAWQKLYRFNPQRKSLEIPIQPDVDLPENGLNFYTQITEDKQGNLWLGTSSSGVLRYDPSTGETTQFKSDESKKGSIPTNVVGVVMADGKGRVWFGSRNKTAYGYYHAEDNQFYYLDANGKPTQDLASTRTNNIFTDNKGNVWVCTEQGILYFDCAGDHPRLIKKYTIADGLSSDYVTWGVADKQDIVWLVAGHELCRLDKMTGQISRFGKQDGYTSANFGIGRLRDGSIYLSAASGFFKFNPESLKPLQQKYPLVLTSFKVNDKVIYDGSQLGNLPPFVVPNDGHFFSLEFTGLNMTNPELGRYEYQLEGFDSQWINAEERHYANFTNIPAGRYQFKVKLKGNPPEEALVVPIVVEVAFYKTDWFWILVTLLAVAGLTWFYLHRQQQARALRDLQSKAQLLEKEKALMQYESLRQQLNPHFLFNSLTSLNSLITIDPKAASGFLDSLSKIYRYILKSSEREVVPLSDELKFAESFVKLQKTRFGEGFQVHFKVDEEDLHRKIVPVTLQNLIENAIKHNIIDEETPLVVEIFSENGFLVVRNNLQKKNFVESSNGRGLVHLKSFYKYLSDQDIEIEENGKHYTIKIPLV